jgi:hypothetical protein
VFIHAFVHSFKELLYIQTAKSVWIFDGNMATVNTVNMWKPTEIFRPEEDDFSVPRSLPRSFRSAAPPEKGTNDQLGAISIVTP